jgi:hypothetical protein
MAGKVSHPPLGEISPKVDEVSKSEFLPPLLLSQESAGAKLKQ